jgi:hypothetical protein
MSNNSVRTRKQLLVEFRKQWYELKKKKSELEKSQVSQNSLTSQMTLEIGYLEQRIRILEAEVFFENYPSILSFIFDTRTLEKLMLLLLLNVFLIIWLGKYVPYSNNDILIAISVPFIIIIVSITLYLIAAFWRRVKKRQEQILISKLISDNSSVFHKIDKDISLLLKDDQL